LLVKDVNGAAYSNKILIKIIESNPENIIYNFI
jgi:hypothetical protein